MEIAKEDYEEPCCPLKPPGKTEQPIPVRRVLDKLDEYLGRNDYDAAERHLAYWYEEAVAGNDPRGQLTVLNEQIGLYRKREDRQNGLQAVEAALALLNTVQPDASVTAATTWINAATAYKAFGEAEKALPLYERAKELYETLLSEDDDRLGGLYNNMALTVMDLGDLTQAEDLFGKALDVMAQIPHGEAEMAITYCNLADLAVASRGMEDAEETVRERLETAWSLLDTPALPRDGYYAFVCEKCAPTFGYYGYFGWERELMKRAEALYERT